MRLNLLKNSNVKKSYLYGIIGSVLTCIVLFIILWFTIIPSYIIKEREDEGIMVSYGNNDDAGGPGEMPVGMPAPRNSVKGPAQNKEIRQTAATSKNAAGTYMTQTDKSYATAEQKGKSDEHQEQITNERERLATEQRLAGQKRNEQDAIDKANAMNGMFGNSNSKGGGTGTGNGSGSGSGEGLQGNPAGKGTSGGNFWSLSGRSLTGRLVSPTYNRDVEGKVTVNIRVAENGNVISASIGSPTTISDAETRNAATAAAKSTHFTAGKGISAGSITYNFKLK